MKEYDLIVIGTGSAMNIVGPMIQDNPKIKIAIIDKDEPGGICLTRGCIPSKIILYPAELVQRIREAKALGVDAEIKSVNFNFIMQRMRKLIEKDINSIRQGLSGSENIDYYPAPAEFIGPYTLKVSRNEIHSKMIFLCTGSEPVIPSIKGLEKLKYHTSDTILKMDELPESMTIIGGGYIAAELGFFLSSMGCNVTIIGRNPFLIPDEEPEASRLLEKILSKYMRILTNHEATEIRNIVPGLKEVVAVDRVNGNTMSLKAEEVLIATGRGPTSKILHPEKSGVQLTPEGWIKVNEYLETTQPGIWAFGDADGKHLFKHVANYESIIVYNNAILKQKVKADYHAIPHAVFTYPEVAAVGMSQSEAVARYGEENVLIGYYKYEDTAKGEAMNATDYFVKVIVQADTGRVLGGHIVGPEASILIHEIIVLMNTKDQTLQPAREMMHIHPSLSEVVDRAFGSLLTVEQYRHMRKHEESHERSIVK